MPKSHRSRSKLSWKQEYGGVPVWGIAGALGLLAVLLAVPAVVNATTPASAPYVRPSDAFAEPTPTTEAQTAVFLGDSYTSGYLLPDSAQGFAYLTASDLGWAATVDGQPSTGYVATGAEGSGNASYLTRAATIDPAADVVIVSGGVNDEAAYRADPEAFAAAVTDTLSAARSAAPDARLVVVGPFWPYESADSITAMNGIIGAAAVAAGAEFIDPLAEGWMTAVPMMDDGLHPTVEGHRVLADRLAAVL